MRVNIISFWFYSYSWYVSARVQCSMWMSSMTNGKHSNNEHTIRKSVRLDVSNNKWTNVIYTIITSHWQFVYLHRWYLFKCLLSVLARFACFIFISFFFLLSCAVAESIIVYTLHQLHKWAVWMWIWVCVLSHYLRQCLSILRPADVCSGSRIATAQAPRKNAERHRNKNWWHDFL